MINDIINEIKLSALDHLRSSGIDPLLWPAIMANVEAQIKLDISMIAVAEKADDD